MNENSYIEKYCLYARKSSESDERQAMSIDSHIKEMKDLALREGPDCPERAINERDLIVQLGDFLEENCNHIKVSDELARTISHHMNIVEHTPRAHGVNYDKAKPLAEYGRYVLTTGSYRQQAELVKSIDGAFKLRNRQLIR